MEWNDLEMEEMEALKSESVMHSVILDLADKLEGMGGDEELVELSRYSINCPISETHYDIFDALTFELVATR